MATVLDYISGWALFLTTLRRSNTGNGSSGCLPGLITIHTYLAWVDYDLGLTPNRDGILDRPDVFVRNVISRVGLLLDNPTAILFEGLCII